MSIAHSGHCPTNISDSTSTTHTTDLATSCRKPAMTSTMTLSEPALTQVLPPVMLDATLTSSARPRRSPTPWARSR
jgi:hypothetical protein